VQALLAKVLPDGFFGVPVSGLLKNSSVHNEIKMRSPLMMENSEPVPELADSVGFMDGGCLVFHRLHRFNIRIKTINYDG
jgi:hypothetical protein